MRRMSEKDSSISRLKIKVDNQRDQLERVEEMAGIEFRAKVISVQSGLSVKLEEQTQTCESKVRNLVGLRLSNFSQCADVRSRLSEQSFVECTKKIKTAMEEFKRKEAVIKRLSKWIRVSPLTTHWRIS
jgi:hypothetical protein